MAENEGELVLIVTVMSLDFTQDTRDKLPSFWINCPPSTPPCGVGPAALN